jgi:hypothetical protein
MYVMHLFTYPSQWPYSHRVIIVLWGLQIFPCPENQDMTCVHPATSSVQRTSVLAPFTVLWPSKQKGDLCHLESSAVSHLRFELHVANLILQARQRWVATLTSGWRFVWSILSRVSFGLESPWFSVRIPNSFLRMCMPMVTIKLCLLLPFVFLSVNCVTENDNYLTNLYITWKFD